jgi:hypothetical protein
MIKGISAAEAGEVFAVEERSKTLGRLVQGLEAGTAPKADQCGGGGCSGNELATVER